MSKNEQEKSSQMETDALEFITNLIAIHQEIQLDEIAEELKNNPQERSIVKQCNFLPLRFRKAGRAWCGGSRETH